MRRTALLVSLLVPVLAAARPKPSRDCVKQCDDLFRPMAAECRAAEKGGGRGHHDDPGEAKNMAESCKATMSKMKAACLKQCAAEPKRSKE